MLNHDYKTAVEKCEHYKAIGITDICIDSELGGSDPPWEYVYDLSTAGSHRLDIASCVAFHANHPCGLSFKWFFDIEPYTANGKNSYEIDTEACRVVIGKLSPIGREKFRKYLSDCAKAVQAKAFEWKEISDRQFRDAATLAELANI